MKENRQNRQTKHIRYNGINGIIGKIQSRKLQTLEIRVSLCLEGLEKEDYNSNPNPNPISLEIGIITEFGKNQWLVTSYIDKSVKLPIMGTKNQAIDALIDILENKKKEEMKGMKE